MTSATNSGLSPARVAVVTGASSGIGMALAQLLARSGVNLVLHGRRAERLAALAEEFPGIRWLAGDLCDPDSCERLLSTAVEHFGHVDYAINNAGVNHTSLIETVDIERLCQMVRINVEAAYRFTYTFLKHFRRHGAGHLIHTTSVMGHKVRETAGGYAGTKHAIEALCEALRLELARSAIRVSCVAPGLVDTELHRDLDVHPSISRNISRPLEPADVANAIFWVMSQPPHVNVPQLIVLPQDHAI
jgi:NADP-dependent 3-hydroxy acid dehydrogenase YdfG